MFGPSETSGNEPNKKIDCRSERIAPAAPITLQNKIRLYAVRPEATPAMPLNGTYDQGYDDR